MVKVVAMDIISSRIFGASLDEAIGSIPDVGRLDGKCVMITGSTGLIGSALVAMLARISSTLANGLTVVACGRSVRRVETLFEDYVGAGIVIPLEYHAERAIESSFCPNYIIHAASNAHPAAFSSDPVGTIEANVRGLRELLDFARHTNAERTVYVSSGEVYGEIQGAVRPYSEEEAGSGAVSLSSPRSAYTEAKRMAEVLCVSYAAQYSSNVVIVRPSHTYGPNQTAADSRAHAQFLRSAAAGEEIVMKSAGLQVRSYTYVADCASGILSVMLAGRSGEAYNIANPDAVCSIAEFAGFCASAGGSSVIRLDEEGSLSNSPISKQVLGVEKLLGLGWLGHYDCKNGISISVQALREEGHY